MNLGEATIVLRHRPVLEVLDLAIRFVRSLAPSVFGRLIALVTLPCWFALLACRYAFDWSWGGVWLTTLIVLGIAQLPYTVLSGRLLFDRHTNLASVLKQTAHQYPKFLVSQLAYSALWFPSTIIVVGPLFVSAAYCFAPEALVLERSSALGCLRRSRTFLAGRGGTGMETALLRSVMLLSFVAISEFLGQALVSVVLDIQFPMESLWTDGGSPFAVLGALLWLPYGTTFRFLSYANERTRQDGWDIQVAFLALSQPRTFQPSESRP